MPKRMPKKIQGEFKQIVAEIMQKEKMSYCEADRQLWLPNDRATGVMCIRTINLD